MLSSNDMPRCVSCALLMQSQPFDFRTCLSRTFNAYSTFSLMYAHLTVSCSTTPPYRRVRSLKPCKRGLIFFVRQLTCNQSHSRGLALAPSLRLSGWWYRLLQVPWFDFQGYLNVLSAAGLLLFACDKGRRLALPLFACSSLRANGFSRQDDRCALGHGRRSELQGV